MRFFLGELCEDPIDGTGFDCDVMDSITELSEQFADKPKMTNNAVAKLLKIM